jgi:hypothetical protein
MESQVPRVATEFLVKSTAVLRHSRWRSHIVTSKKNRAMFAVGKKLRQLPNVTARFLN